MLIDISPNINSNTAVFPDDQKFKRSISHSFYKGHNFELSSLTTTPHIGAHADAPSHYSSEGESIERRSLDRYYGRCQVFHIKGLRPFDRVQVENIDSNHFEERVLIRTDSYDHQKWSEEFNSLSPELINYLHQKGVVLVGIDTPSIDPANSKNLESHQEVSRNDMSILEGLDLRDVKSGIYKLIAFPLKLDGVDASPVRAVLDEI